MGESTDCGPRCQNHSAEPDSPTAFLCNRVVQSLQYDYDGLSNGRFPVAATESPTASHDAVLSWRASAYPPSAKSGPRRIAALAVDSVVHGASGGGLRCACVGTP